MANRIRSVFLPLALTLACLSGAMYLGIIGVTTANASTDEPQSLCSNTECEGVRYCRYNPNVDCVFSDFKVCTNFGCSTTGN